MKIDVSRIVIDHINTLRDARSAKTSIVDIIVFYLIPIIIGAISYFELFVLSKDLATMHLTNRIGFEILGSTTELESVYRSYQSNLQ
jgi:hypothetical protein